MQTSARPGASIVASLLALLLSAQMPAARAGLIGADEAAGTSQSEVERAKVQSFLERADVKQRLQALGVDALASGDRVAALSDAEVHALAQRIDTLPAGGALSNQDLILILLIAILVALLL